MKTAVMTDTNSGITREEAGRSGIYLLPMPVIIRDQVFYEGETINEEEFYAAQASGVPVSTSQPSPGAVLELWERAFADGNDEIVYIPMTSGLSQSCEAAAALAAGFNGRVAVADNHRISVPLRESVMQAVELAAQGRTAAEIKVRLEKEAYWASIYLTVETLEYLKKGGRITPAAALLGSVLNIRPILTIQGGKLDAFARVRGRKRSIEVMVQALQRDLETRFAGWDKAAMRVCAAGTALSEQAVSALKGALLAIFPGSEVIYNPLSISIGCHTGPGAMGVGICF